jgi:hypothetical protein
MARFEAAEPNGVAVQQLEVLVRTAIYQPGNALVGFLLQGALEVKIGLQTSAGPDFGSEEIHRGQDFGVQPDEFLPRPLLFPFRRRLQAVPLENVGHGLMSDFVSQIAQRANNPPLSPTATLPGKLQHQILDPLTCRRSPHHGSALRTVELPRDQFPVPPKDGFGANDLRHLFKGLSSQTLADFCKTDPVGVCQPHASVDLIAKDAILRHQVFVSEAEFFVNRTGDICEHSFPIHRAKVEHGRGPS